MLFILKINDTEREEWTMYLKDENHLLLQKYRRLIKASKRKWQIVKIYDHQGRHNNVDHDYLVMMLTKDIVEKMKKELLNNMKIILDRKQLC